MEHNMRAGRYCIPDLGERGGDRPDLLILEPASRVDSRGNRKLDGHAWSEKTMVAVEVETAPNKHPEQIIKNHRKNTDAGYQVWFVVFNDGDLDLIGKILDGAGVARQDYHVDVVNAEAPISEGVAPPATPFLVTRYVDLH